MPYKSEKIKYPKELDNRRKLTDSERESVLLAYIAGDSIRGLARKFGVDRGTIKNIVNPEQYQAQLKRYSEEKHSHKYYDKTKHAQYMRRYRQRKQALYLKGLIK